MNIHTRENFCRKIFKVDRFKPQSGRSRNRRGRFSSLFFLKNTSYEKFGKICPPFRRQPLSRFEYISGIYKWRISEDGKDSPVLPFDSALWSMTNEFESVASTWTHNLKPFIRHAVIRFVLSREITGGRALIPSPRFRAPKFFNENLRTFPARRDGQFSLSI